MELSEAIQARRAYRSLDPVEITDDMISQMAEAAILAATCSNNQPARYIFVRDPEVLGQMQEAMTKHNTWTQRASMIIAVFSRLEYDCKPKGRDYYVFAMGMQTAQLILKATDMGLVAHPIAGYSPSKVREILGIPEEMTVITLVNVGKKSDTINELLTESQIERELHRPERLPHEKFMAMDHFNDNLIKELPEQVPKSM